MSILFLSGTNPTRSDTRWVRWFKLAKRVQNKPLNAPAQTNSRRQLVVKTLKSLQGL